MTTPIKPSPDMIEELKRQLRSIPDLRKEIARAKTAGIDVAQQEQELNELEKKLKSILAVYG